MESVVLSDFNARKPESIDYCTNEVSAIIYGRRFPCIIIGSDDSFHEIANIVPRSNFKKNNKQVYKTSIISIPTYFHILMVEPSCKSQRL